MHSLLYLLFLICIGYSYQVDILSCGGFVKSEIPISYSKVFIKLFTKQGSLKYQADCAPNNGYYLIPLYDKGDYIMQVEPPQGWSFEPTSVPLHIDGKADPCSQGKDINFIFKGFSITGKVTNRGQKDGPPGIKIQLQTVDGQVLQEQISSDKGTFSFSNVLPKSYVLVASHPFWSLDNTKVPITVDQDNVHIEESFVVGGYDVQGEVRSEGEPIQGVHLLLFHETAKESIKGCDNTMIQGFKPETAGKLKFLCRTTSTKSGKFIFPAVPSGKFTLIPFYKGDHTEFEVSPSKVEFEVSQGSVQFPQPFQVQGFSVSGRVFKSPNSDGLIGAQIYLDGKEQTSSQKDGWYYLDNMRAGSYKLEVKMNQIAFRPLVVKITPNAPQLPNLIASTFEICGKLNVHDSFQNEARKISIAGSATLEISTNKDGSFCQHLTPGNYKFTPIVAGNEGARGLTFSPPSKEIKLSYDPISNLNFEQFFASINGQVNCIKKCKDVSLQLNSLTDKKLNKVIKLDENKDTFSIASVLPGKYELEVSHDQWCWDSSKMSIIVGESNKEGLTFVHSGYQMKIDLSHSTSLKIKNAKKEEIKQLSAGSNMFCVHESGEYTLIPEGCYKFEKSSYTLDTSNLKPLALNAIEYLLSGSVLSPLNTSDIMLEIIQTGKEKHSTKEQLLLKKPAKKDGKLYLYDFSLWVKPKTKIEILPSSKTLLFQPLSHAITSQEDCLLNALQIKGQIGLFIKGIISPPINEVEIIVKNPSGAISAKVNSNIKGEYAVGPLDGDLKYSIEAIKEGYVFTAKSKALGHFDAFKLAEVLVQVIGENSEPLSGVLLSLSGGVDYRKNSITQEDGKLNFKGLSPGQYFLRSVLKEYKFEPTSQIIEVKEGGTIPVLVKGKRVAFSCFGATHSLTGEDEPGVAVEAIGKGNCIQYQEEAISQQDGTFRIRGLLPQCVYELRLKPSAESNQHIERSVPKNHILQVTNGDIMDQRLVIMRKLTQMDVIGIVNSAYEHLPILKIRLYKGDDLEQPLQTIPLTQGFFYGLSFLPIDNTSYTLALESPHSSTTVSFRANTSFQMINFDYSPKPYAPEQEIAQGSFVAFPMLAVLIVFLIYNYSSFMPYFKHLIETFQALLTPSNEPQSSETITIRKKTKPRKA